MSTLAPTGPSVTSSANGVVEREGAKQPPTKNRNSGLSRARDVWAAMDNRDVGRRVPGTAVVAVTAAIVQLIAAFISVGNGAALWYADALSHLVISGRITTGFNAGIQQLGTVWLPAPHLITAPFASNLWLWQTGWAAAIIGVLAMAASVAALYRICARLGFGRNARLLACVVFLANPSALYLYTTAMTEPVLFACLLGSIAGLTHYATAKRPLSGGEIAVYAGLPGAVAMLSRYEGWVLLASGVLFIILVELRRSSGPRAIQKATASALPTIGALVALPVAAIAWWLMYNYVNFGDPLEFIFGKYSAFNQQDVLAAQGLLTTKGNLPLTLTVIGGAAWQVIMPVVIILGIVGLSWLMASYGFGTHLFIAGVLFSPFVFNIAALYLGQTTIENDFSLPTGYFNTRYALTLLPLMAFCVGVLAEALNSKTVFTRLGRLAPGVFSIALAVAVIGQSAYVLQDPIRRSPVIEEGDFQVHVVRGPVDPIWEYLDEHYDGTALLVDEVSNQLRPQSGIPLNDFYIVASGNYFEDVLKHPAGAVGWIIVNTNDESLSHHQDIVLAEMTEFPENFSSFRRVIEASGIVLYRSVR